MKHLTKTAIITAIISTHASATIPISTPPHIIKDKIIKTTTLYLSSVNLISISITPYKEGCIIFDTDGNVLTFPNRKSEQLLSNKRIAFNTECLSVESPLNIDKRN